MYAFRRLSALLLIGLVAGCSTPRITGMYSPSILMEGKGDIWVGEFVYTPAKQGILKPNQAGHPSNIFLIYSDDNIDLIVKSAISKELKFIGYRINPAAENIVQGEILEFSCIKQGYVKSEFLVKIKFTVIKANIGNVIYENIHEGRCSLPDAETIHISIGYYTALTRTIESFLTSVKTNNLI